MNARPKLFGVTRNVFWLGMVSFFNDFSGEMVQSVMPVFLTSALGAPAFFVGLIDGTADALASIFKLLSGWISDKLGKRKAPAVYGYSLSVATRAFLVFAAAIWQVFALRIIDRVGKGFRDAPRDALIAESTDPKELGRSYGFHRAMDTLGATFGPLVGFFIIFFLKDGYRILFIVAFFLGLFAIGSFIFVKDAPPSQAPVKKVALDWSVFQIHKKFIITVLTLFIFGLSALPIGLVLLKAKEVGNIGEVPLMYFVYSLAFVATSLPLGRLADRLGEKPVIGFGFFLASIAYAGLALTSHLTALVICFIVLGIYSAATDGMQRMLAARSLPREWLATGQGFLNMALGFSSLGAGVIGGLLWTLQKSEIALWYAAGMALIGLMLFSIISLTRFIDIAPAPV